MSLYTDALAQLDVYPEATLLGQDIFVPIVGPGGASNIQVNAEGMDLSDMKAPDAVGSLPFRTLPPFNTASPIFSSVAIDATGTIPDRTLSASQVSVPTVPATSSDVMTQILTPVSSAITGQSSGGAIAAVQPPPHRTALFWFVILAILYWIFRS